MDSDEGTDIDVFLAFVVEYLYKRVCAELSQLVGTEQWDTLDEADRHQLKTSIPQAFQSCQAL